MSSRHRIFLNRSRLVAALAAGDSYRSIGRMLGCSDGTVARHAMLANAHGCVRCEIKAAEIARLRDAYMLLEEAFLAFMDDRPTPPSSRRIKGGA